MDRRPPRATRTDTLFPYTTLFRSLGDVALGAGEGLSAGVVRRRLRRVRLADLQVVAVDAVVADLQRRDAAGLAFTLLEVRSEEHTSELPSLMRISYAVFCLKKKNTHKHPYLLYITHTIITIK